MTVVSLGDINFFRFLALVILGEMAAPPPGVAATAALAVAG